MTAPADPWSELDVELNARLSTVGFRPADFPATPPAEPAGMVYAAFEAPYALLYTIRLTGENAEPLTAATTFACETMRVALAKSGANDWSRDGYVLALFPAQPASPEAKQALRAFEQSRSICRRHAVWPEAPAKGEAPTWTQRLDRITVLALPHSEAPTAPSQPPPPGPKFLEDIHSRLKANASYKLVAEEIVRAAREQEDFHAP
jgi:hypothetical protein